MLKKTYILSFIIIFFAANTGIPIALHYCEMMNSTSLQDCSACEVKVEVPASCCDKQENSNLPSISKLDLQCCSVVLKDAALTDFYLTLQKKDEILNLNTSLISTVIKISTEETSKQLNKNLIKPHIPKEEKIYIFNSVFLI